MASAGAAAVCGSPISCAPRAILLGRADDYYRNCSKREPKTVDEIISARRRFDEPDATRFMAFGGQGGALSGCRYLS